jgi:di/tripeptidase
MSFIGKIVGYFVNEIVVKVLANNKTFQRFAVKTDHHIKTSAEKAKGVSEVIVTKAKTTAEKKINDVAQKDTEGFNFGLFVKNLAAQADQNKAKSVKKVEKHSSMKGGQ